MKKKFKFMENNLYKSVVGVTYETCAVKDCLERASPIHLEKKMRNENTALIVEQYVK
jgi:hypothetical protein